MSPCKPTAFFPAEIVNQLLLLLLSAAWQVPWLRSFLTAQEGWGYPRPQGREMYDAVYFPENRESEKASGTPGTRGLSVVVAKNTADRELVRFQSMC